MSSNFHDAPPEQEIQPPSDRATGLVFSGAMLVAAVLVRSLPLAAGACLMLAMAFAAASWLVPHALHPLAKAWFKLSLLLNRIVSPVVMFVLFCVTIVPFGLVMQLRRDPLRRKRTAGASYWIARDQSQGDGSMSNQF